MAMLLLIQMYDKETKLQKTFLIKAYRTQCFHVIYQHVQVVTTYGSYSLARIRQCIGSLVDDMIFSALDLYNDYWHNALSNLNRKRTTFLSYHTVHFNNVRKFRLGLKMLPVCLEAARI